uniref:Zinc finger protein 57 n=1 Tax=Cacopsylla melanoneura TaxID=428564 RepID=A0A8D9ACZ3_9HEMI
MNIEKGKRPTNIVKLDIAKVEIRDIDNHQQPVEPHLNVIPQVIRIDRKFIHSITTIENFEEQIDIKHDTKETGSIEDATGDMPDSEIKIEPDYEIKSEYEDNEEDTIIQYDQEWNHVGENPPCVEKISSDGQWSSEFNEDINTVEEKICLDCNLSFNTNKLLTEHVQLYHQKKQIRCETCRTCFSGKFDLLRHKCCEKCRTCFSRKSDLLRHKCYECNICGKITNHKFGYQRHLETHIPRDEKEKMMRNGDIYKRPRFECNYCSMSYSVKQILKRHIENVHYGLKYACSQCGKQYSTQRTCSNCTPKETCPVCKKIFSTHVGFVEHVKHMHQLKILGHQGNNDPMNHTEFKNIILCLKCTERFDSMDDWTNHLKSESHNQKQDDHVKGYTCPICNRVSTRKTHRTMHMRVVHGISMHEHEVFHCNYCDEDFTERSDAVEHIKSETHKHNRQKFECKICKKTFLYAKTLKTHTCKKGNS